MDDHKARLEAIAKHEAISTRLLDNINGVLITGGTGFLGRALARALLEQTGIERICLFSRNEYAQVLARAEIPDPDLRLRWFVGDVRDQLRLRRAMDGVGVVIHAAALKRVEVGEYNPAEMVKTNVLGAINVIDAAIDAGVHKIVAVSTDKACEPLNAYGATKLTMEKLMLAANAASGGFGPKISVVRYGNVAGSTGSVIPTWRALKAAGATKVPVTHPRCTRYWMRVDQAVDLILWTVNYGEGGELVVPLLPAYRIEDLAAAMDLEMDVRGIGPGEKLDEMMIAACESPAFRHVPPYLIAGGIARRFEEPNVAAVRSEMLTVEQLRSLLKDLP